MCSSSMGASDAEDVEIEDLSGWDDIRDFFTNTLALSQQYAFDENSFVDENIDDINNVLATEKIQLKLTRIMRKKIKCPLCAFETRLKSTKGLSVRNVLKVIKRHLLLHEQEIEEMKDKDCPICGFSCSEKYMRKHYRMEHPDEDVPAFPESSKSTGVLASLLKMIDERAKSAIEVKVPVKNDRIQKNSFFRGFRSRHSLKTFQELIRKEFEKTASYSLFFQFKVSTYKKIPYRWACGLCENDTVGYLPHAFTNDLSLRLYVLRHFSIYHTEEDSIMQLCDREWKNLTKDTGLELQRYNKWSSRFEMENRSAWLCLEPYNNENKDLILEMISREVIEDNTRLACESVICLICLNSYKASRIEPHFHTDECHRQLKSHPEKTEFVEIGEIAEFNVLDLNIYPMGLLRYSKMFCLTEDDETTSVPFYKWRCPLPCGQNGHISDVLHFPKATVLRLYVLKHFMEFHAGFFADSFIEHEWKLLSNTMKISEPLLHTDPISEADNFELDDPNDFQWPLASMLIFKSYKDFKVCYFCYWCGLPDAFLDHITIHGYLPTDKRLVSNAVLYKSQEKKLKKNCFVPHEIESFPRKVLGPLGRGFRRTLTEPSKNEEQRLELETLSSCCDTEEKLASDMDSMNSQPLADVSFSSSLRSSARNSARSASLKITQSLDEGAWKDAIADSASTSSSDDDNSSDSDGGQRRESPESEEDISQKSKDDATEDNEEDDDNDMIADTTLTEKSSIVVSSAENRSDTSSNCFSRNAVLIEQATAEKMSLIKKKFEHAILEDLPAPTFSELKALELMKLRRCFLCKGTPLVKTSGQSGISTGMLENYVLAHYIMRHSNDPTVHLLLERKRSMLLSKEPFYPTPFLLEHKPYLVCSSCSSYKATRFSILLTHFIGCVKVTEKKIIKEPMEPSLGSTVCRLSNCGLKLRAGKKYDPNYTQLIHLLSSHAKEKEAYALAMKLIEHHNFAETLPYTDVPKSFALTIDKSHLMLVCSKCEHSFHKPTEILAHSLRYHAIVERKICPYNCGNDITRKKGVSWDIRVHLHLIEEHFMEDDVFSHFDERIQKLFTDHEIFTIDLARSVEESREVHRSVHVCVVCDNVVMSKFHQHKKICSKGFDETFSLNQTTPGNRSVNIKNSSAVSCSSRTSSLARVACKFCRKSFLSCHSEEATLIAHSLKNHRGHKLVKEWFDSLNIEEVQDRIPFLYIRKGLEAYNMPSSSSSCLFCSVCSKNFKTLSHLLGHYTTHNIEHGSVKKTENSRFCSFCKKHLKRAVNYSGLVGFTAHMIECHPEEVTSSYFTEEDKKENLESIPFIDVEKSVASKKLICSLCSQDYKMLRNMLHHCFISHSLECSTARRVSESENNLDEEISQSTPKRSCRREPNFKIDFGAEASPILPPSASDKEKWKNTFKRYGKLQIDLREKSLLMEGSGSKSKQTKLNSFMKKVDSTASQEPDKTSCEETTDQLDSVETNSNKSSKNSDGWLQMNNTQNVIAPAIPALRLKSALESSSASQSCENLAEALGSMLDVKSTNSSFQNDSVLSLLPSFAVDNVSSPSVAPCDLSHVPGVNGYKCKRCDFVGLKIQDIVKHMKLIHNTGTAMKKPEKRDIISSCIICRRCFASRQKLYVHIRDAHPDEKRPFPCSYCGKGFSNPTRLREHERRNHEENFNVEPESLKCEHCSVVFLSVRNKKLHEKRHKMSKD
ncbi:unnamed protein product [Auanema sp. JU1783]|nr:unnamed protein product [Auanema sp. JU1783]